MAPHSRQNSASSSAVTRSTWPWKRVRYMVMSASCPTSDDEHSASSTMTTRKPRSTALSTVESTQTSVSAPEITTVPTFLSTSKVASAGLLNAE